MNLKLSLTASVILGQGKEVQQQSKEEFFSIKKPSRRTKQSKDNLDVTAQANRLEQNISPNSYSIIRRLQNLDVKQLHYSLAETEDPDALLEFKAIQPKKKKLSSKIYRQQNDGNHLLQSRTPYFSPEKNFSKSIKMTNSITNQKLDLSVKSNELKKSDQKTPKIPFYSPKKIITKTLTSLFSHKVPEVQEKEYPDLCFKDFIIIKQIGEGTYSKVYKAVHKKTGFICALKVLQKSLMKQLKVEENAVRQIKILSCLSWHPNVASWYGSFADQNAIYLIFQLCTDGDSYTKMKKIRQKPKTHQIKNQITMKEQDRKEMLEKVGLLHEICEGLRHLHEHSIMHRDIKPENVLLTMGNSIKISDFGWSVYNSKNNLRKTLCGTPLYLAPEFITTCRYNDAVDVWALGVMAYEFFTNEFPFKIKSVNDLIKIAEEQINFQRIKCPVARDFCMKALIKDRHYRSDIWELLQHDLFQVYKTSQF